MPHLDASKMDVPLVEFMYLVFTRMPGESYRRRLQSLLLCLRDVFPAVTNSLECWFCTGTLGLSLFQIVARLVLLLSLVYWAVQWSWLARVNTFCNLSRRKSREVAASLPGRFLSRRCFTLCVTMEVEPRTAMQYKCQHCCSCKNYRGKGMEGGKKCLCVVFWLTRRSRVRGKNAFWGILQHEHQVIACCQTHSDYGPPKMPLKLAV